MKKGVALLLGALILSSLLIGVVSADPLESLGNALSSAFTGLGESETLKFIIGDTAASGTLDTGSVLFSKVLFLILIFCLVWVVFEKIPLIGENDKIQWVVTAVVSILAVRFITGGFVAAILLPYTTLGVTMSVIFPFLIFSAFVYNVFATPTARRISWAVFGAVFLFIYFLRYGDLGDAKNLYPVIVIASLVMMTLDGTIMRLKNKMKAEKAMSVTQYRKYLDLLRRYEEAQDRYETAVSSGDPALIARAKADLAVIGGQLTKMKM
ncbi:hypothetical protein FJZ17_02290 [Candidatus Pacearchaeota archaeon]|nr:hypothetical protein [Candidatus Pacearchaeota archaeon]